MRPDTVLCRITRDYAVVSVCWFVSASVCEQVDEILRNVSKRYVLRQSKLVRFWNYLDVDVNPGIIVFSFFVRSIKVIQT